MAWAAKADVSCETPTVTDPRLACRSKMPYGMATPVESERKSWSLTNRGDRSQRAPGFLKLPTSSCFLVSTLIIEAVWDGDAGGVGAKVVVVDESGRQIPARARILEVADQFALLGVDADDGDRKSTRLNASHANISYAVF